MTRTLAALIATLLILPGASYQDDSKADKDKAKEEAKKRDDDAKAALKAYKELRAKAKTADDVIEAINSSRRPPPRVCRLAGPAHIPEAKLVRGGGPPLPGVPQGDSSNNQRQKRHNELTEPTRKAINHIYKKYDSKAKLNTYKE